MMKTMKKILGLITVMAILISCMVMASAAGAATVSVGSAEAKPGDSVKIDVTISEATYAGYGFKVVYDSNVLTLDSIDRGEMSMGTFNYNTASNKVSAMNPTDYSGSGVLFTLNFTVSTSAADGTYEVKLASDGVVDATITDLDITLQDGYVKVETPHVHDLVHYDAVAATCVADGQLEYWYCAGCDCYFIDVNGNLMNTTRMGVVVPGGAAYHAFEHHDAVAPSCVADGVQEYWYCAVCDCYFIDVNGNKVNTNAKDLIIPGGAAYHAFEHHDAVAPSCVADGVQEYWYCAVCDCYFIDVNGNKVNTSAKNLIIPGGTEYHELEHHDAVAPTCTENGVAEHWYCPVCDCYFIEVNGNLVNTNAKDLVVLATGHNYENGVCTGCGEKERDESPKTGDTAPVVLMAALAILAAGAFVVLNKKRA